MKITGIFLLLALAAGGCASNPDTRQEATQFGTVVYEEELDKVLNRSPDADFYKLRISFTNTDKYSPYNFPERSMLDEASQYFKESQFEQCLKKTNEVLSLDYTNLNAHYLAMACSFEAGNEEGGRYHRYVVKGLMESISDRGDGKTEKTAYTTISPDELYAFLHLLGLEVKGQALVNGNEGVFDLMSVADPETGKKFDLYFNITIQMSKGFKFLEER